MMRVLLLVSVSLLGLSAVLYVQPVDVSASAETETAAAANVRVEQAYRAKPIAQYRAISARPLFVKERRPGAEPEPIEDVAEPAGPVADLNQILLGVMELDGEWRALIAPRAGADGTWFGLGGSVEGWRLTAIDADTVRLEQREKVAKLTLYNDTVSGDAGQDKTDAPADGQQPDGQREP